ncbi:response regulator transcription factor [Undibacterium seohonense]|uniref:Response regulator transcription factor n=1 Tax=Undibacterium seohonense TaxID=1344950 RepID=A0ABR6X308_9BURK|nr:response regulator transcription factor [Undibacterium seohonense]MBC3807176.1 response regulator transcription factor [Undibacterium seohonense]
MANKSILLIDDHSLFRSGLKTLICNSLANVDIVESNSLEDAMRLPNPLLHLILLDIKLQGLNGLDGAILLKQKWPETPIVVISADNSLETLRLAQEKGARYFIPKTSSADAILQIIIKALDDPGIEFTKTPKEFESRSTSNKNLLTPRQYEVLDLVCKGHSNKMIARQLELSENTVRCHVQVLLAALNASNRAEAAFTARRMGLVA